MSEERLDIWLKDKREQLKNATVFINENGNEAVEVSLSVLNKLFEQAKRVQELDEQVYAIGETYRQEHQYSNKLYAENKRYREAFERIKEAPRKAHSGSDCVDIIFEIIEELEGESE